MVVRSHGLLGRQVSLQGLAIPEISTGREGHAHCCFSFLVRSRAQRLVFLQAEQEAYVQKAFRSCWDAVS